MCALGNDKFASIPLAAPEANAIGSTDKGYIFLVTYYHLRTSHKGHRTGTAQCR